MPVKPVTKEEIRTFVIGYYDGYIPGDYTFGEVENILFAYAALQTGERDERIAKLEAGLRELVDLKTLKDTEGKTDDYLERQPKAWITATLLLNRPNGV